MPQGPDSGFQFYGIGGKRRGYFDTSATTHALDEPCYIVEPHPPGTKLVPNGLPVFPLYYANDDDGERKLGRDSALTFTAPADGEYLVRVSDVRELGGDRFAYRLIDPRAAAGLHRHAGRRQPDDQRRQRQGHHALGRSHRRLRRRHRGRHQRPAAGLLGLQSDRDPGRASRGQGRGLCRGRRSQAHRGERGHDQGRGPRGDRRLAGGEEREHAGQDHAGREAQPAGASWSRRS